MHMADALISPAVGGVMWAASAGLLAWSSRKLQSTLDDNRVPLMGVLGAFVFAAQMINFSIPGTGSSGHLGGGLLLAALLGPHAAFLTIASVLAVQGLFFADGGLLAMGCNIFNLGFFPCFLAYPFLYKPLVGNAPTRGRLIGASLLGAIVGLQMGAFGVVLETLFSGISELPFSSFVLMMQPIHLAIGVVEGLVTAMLLAFLHQARPELFGTAVGAKPVSLRPVVVGLAVGALLIGGGLSWFASADPDGLEWSMAKVSGKEELEAPEHGIHGSLDALQKRIAFLPDYGFGKSEEAKPETAGAAEEKQPEAWPNVDVGTSLSGVLGGFMTLCLAGLLGLVLRRSRAKASA